MLVFAQYSLCVCLICALPQGARAQWVLTSGSGAYWYQPQAVNRAVDQFLQRPPGGGSEGGSGGGGSSGSGVGALVGANGPVDLRHHNALALGWHGAWPLAPRLELVGTVHLEYARTRWFVQDGVSVLRDDLSVRLRHLALGPSLALRTPLPAPGDWQARVSAGLGADVIWTRTRLSSALLDVRRSDRFTEGFRFVRLDLGHRRFPADRAVLDMQWRDSVDFTLRLGVEHSF